MALKIRCWQMGTDVDVIMPFPSMGADHRPGLLLELPEGAAHTPYNAMAAWCQAYDDEPQNYRIMEYFTMDGGRWLVVKHGFNRDVVKDGGPTEWMLISVLEEEEEEDGTNPVPKSAS